MDQWARPVDCAQQRCRTRGLDFVLAAAHSWAIMDHSAVQVGRVSQLRLDCIAAEETHSWDIMAVDSVALPDMAVWPWRHVPEALEAGVARESAIMASAASQVVRLRGGTEAEPSSTVIG
jgi:hypothetical protein